MTPRVLATGALIAAVTTGAAPWAQVTTAACAALVLLYPALARKLRARRAERPS